MSLTFKLMSKMTEIQSILENLEGLDSSISDSTILLPSKSKIVNQILLGSLLGDGCIYKYKNKYCRYVENHSLKQKDYVLWKNKYLKFNIRTYNNCNGFCKNSKNIYISKGDTKRFSKFYELFYPNGQKVVTKEILDKLEPLGLAVWYMDDGSYDYRDNKINIYSNGFSLEENKIIQIWFKERFDIECKIQSQNQTKLCYIKLNRNNSNKLIEIMKLHIIPSMEYKIGLDKERKRKSRIKKNEYGRKWTRENIGKSRKLKLNWESKNKEKSRESKKRWRLKNKDKSRESTRKWRLKNPQ